MRIVAPPSLAGSSAPVAAGAARGLCESASFSTALVFAVPPEQAWSALMFYEQLDVRPPWLLRWLLPIPIRTEGRKSQVGDEARCLYQGGYLIKRITRIDRNTHYGFEVTEQALAVGSGLQLSGGSYTLRALEGGRTEITAATRYQSARSPRWLWRRVEAAVGHLFHRHILRAMRRSVEPR